MPGSACLVTVVIPVFNSAPTLEHAVRSALRQAISPLEVLIVDDGSTDRSLEEARRIAAADRRVRVIALPENHGKPFAMNRAIAEARGTWIAVLDADDRYADDRLAILIAAAERDGVDLAADNQYFVDAGAGQIVRTALPTGGGDKVLTRRDFIAGSDPFAEFSFGMLKPLIRADFLRRTGLRYRENARLSEDFLYLVEFFAAGGRGVLVSQPLYYWTQAFGSISRRWTETGSGAWRYDFLAARAANMEVRNALRDPRDRDLIGLLDRRDRALRRLHALRELTRSLGENRALHTASLIVRHPSLWPFIARRILLATSRLISPRRPGVPGVRGGVDGTVT